MLKARVSSNSGGISGAIGKLLRRCRDDHLWIRVRNKHASSLRRAGLAKPTNTRTRVNFAEKNDREKKTQCLNIERENTRRNGSPSSGFEKYPKRTNDKKPDAATPTHLFQKSPDSIGVMLYQAHGDSVFGRGGHKKRCR